VGFINIDEEGLEKAVLTSGKELIARERPVIQVSFCAAENLFPFPSSVRNVITVRYVK